MIEEWKIIKEYKSYNNGISLHLKGDKILLSNTGRVKIVNDLLPDLELTLENGGLYISKRTHIYDIYINGLSWSNQTMYRTIYTLFKGKPKKGYNIHHIDFNHLNNSLDNLIEVSPYKHGVIHKENDPTFGINIESKYSIIDNRTEFSKLLKDRIILYKEIKKQQQIDKKEQKELEKQLEIQRKLNSGQYKYNAKGVLRYIHNAKLGTKTGPRSEETRRKISMTLTGRSLPEYQKKQLSDYYKDSKLLTNGIETKRILKDNIETYLANGWTYAAKYMNKTKTN